VLDPISTMLEAANDVTHEAGRATGDENVSGMKTVLGITTIDEAGTEITTELTTVTITDYGTEAGTEDH